MIPASIMLFSVEEMDAFEINDDEDWVWNEIVEAQPLSQTHSQHLPSPIWIRACDIHRNFEMKVAILSIISLHLLLKYFGNI